MNGLDWACPVCGQVQGAMHGRCLNCHALKPVARPRPADSPRFITKAEREAADRLLAQVWPDGEIPEEATA